MPLGTDHIIASEVTTFNPDLWSDEVVAPYKANLVAGRLVRTLNHNGKKGDTINLPTPVRGSASTKTAETQVVLIQAGGDSQIQLSLNKHKHYARLIEDFVNVQALGSLRRFYTDDAGYALAVQVDLDIIAELGAAGNGGTALTIASGQTTDALATARIGDDSAAWVTAGAGNATDITDAGLRSFLKRLDDVNAPMAGRYFMVPTVVKQDLLGFTRYTENAFTGEAGKANSIRNGIVADIYGVEFYMTTQLPTVVDGGAGTDQKLAQLFQRDACVYAEQMGIRTQLQNKLEYLGELFVADMIYGVKNLRSTSIVNVVVPSTASP